MRRVGIAVASLLAALVLTAAHAPADEPKSEARPRDRLVGTWKLVSARYGGREHKFPKGTTTLKHVTPAQFMWVSYDKDGNVTRTAGGAYTLKGEAYEETPEYGLSQDFEVIKGKVHSFTCKIDGNRWHHDGKLDNGLTIEEAWERVEGK